ncbi:MAG: hypothetical protein K2F89_09570 [Treponemataceae bacterium]|nr:hypothetical protein [Treponemataceae bacterium]
MADEFDMFKSELLKNPRIKAEYDALAPEYELIEQLITARTERNMTQKQLAEYKR